MWSHNILSALDGTEYDLFRHDDLDDDPLEGFDAMFVGLSSPVANNVRYVLEKNA